MNTANLLAEISNSIVKLGYTIELFEIKTLDNEKIKIEIIGNCT